MTLAVITSRALDGLEAPPVQVEVHLANGLPSFTLVGLADTEVKESRCLQKFVPHKDTSQINKLRTPTGPVLFVSRPQSLCIANFLTRNAADRRPKRRIPRQAQETWA